MADTRSDEQKAKDAIAMYQLLAEIRRPYEPMIDDILTYVNHSRRRIKDQNAMKGQKTGGEVYDDTALGSVNIAADGLFGYLVAPSMRWFALTLPGKMNFARTSGMRSWSGKRMDEYPDVKEWLEDCEDVLYSAFLRSNFYETMPGFLRDGLSVGTATMIVEEDLRQDRIVFTTPHFRECYFAEDQYGRVDTNYRVYKLTLRQLVDKFSLDEMKNAEKGFERTYEKNPYTEREILHAIFPRTGYDSRRIDSRNKPINSLWVLVDKTKLLLESGYDESAALTWRWRKNSDELCGRSPCFDAYVSVMMGNQMARSNLRAGHKMVDGPMVGPDDLRGKVRSDPGGWTWVSQQLMEKGRFPRPLNEKVQLPFGLEMQDRIDKKIKEFLHVDFFLMLYQAAFNNVQITATQILGMQGEQAAVLGARLGGLQTEAVNPTIDRVFSIERRGGRIPDPPDILAEYGGTAIEVDHMGPLAQAQKRLFKAQGISAGVEALAPLAQMFPEALDIVDPDVTARELLESRGFPSKAIRTEDKIEAIRKRREEQRQIEESLAGASQIAKALPGAGKAVEPGSPLEALMGAASEEGATA